MAILKLYKYPHPILRQACQPVTTFDDDLKQFIQDLTETMYACHGAVGLSAPQVGRAIRVFVVDVSAKTTQTERKVLINPVIESATRKKEGREGCLSFPEYLANVKRATRVSISGLNDQFEPVSYNVEMLEAIAMQHEQDHLDGVLMIDRVSSLATDWIRRKGMPEA
jgi:peptide deformylase